MGLFYDSVIDQIEPHIFIWEATVGYNVYGFMTTYAYQLKLTKKYTIFKPEVCIFCTSRSD